MLSLEEAQAKILAEVQRGSTQLLPLAETDGYWLADDVQAQVDLPPFDNSAMDGYAVLSSDLKMAGNDRPVCLPCSRHIPAGTFPQFELKPGECARIFTGSMFPKGADAVVMQEDVHLRDDSVEFREPIKPLENLRLRGEDLRAGEVIGKAGERITPAAIAIFAASGVGRLKVVAHSRVTIMATGNELTEPGETLPPGAIYESNRVMLAAFLRDAGAIPTVAPVVPDSLHATKAALESAFAQADVVVSSGGVSVGEFDFVKQAFEQIGGKWDFWRVSMKPGKPFVFGKLGEKFFFALPGNPISAAVTFLLLVRPAILKIHGARECALPALRATLAERLANRGDRPHFIRAVMSSDGTVHSGGPQASHLFKSFAGANVLVKLDPNQVLEKGEQVTALLFGNLRGGS